MPSANQPLKVLVERELARFQTYRGDGEVQAAW